MNKNGDHKFLMIQVKSVSKKIVAFQNLVWKYSSVVDTFPQIFVLLPPNIYDKYTPMHTAKEKIGQIRKCIVRSK